MIDSTVLYLTALLNIEALLYIIVQHHIGKYNGQ